MEPSEIVRRCLEHGLLVSYDDVKRIEKSGIDEFVASKRQEPGPGMEEDKEKEGRIMIRHRKFEQKNTVSPNDSVGYYKNKYETLKGMLLSKTSAVSIGNAHDSMASLSLIGMVKQLGERSFTLEDTTGEIEAVYDGRAALDNDDVICARGPVREGKVVCKDIILPDIPLLRAIGKIEASLLLLPKPMETAGLGADIIASTEPVKTDAKNIVISSSPAHISIHKDGKVQLLFCMPESGMSQQEAINMLKKRYLKLPAPQKSLACLAAGQDAYLIEPIPDIFWLLAKGEEWIETYKGVTIVHSFEKPVLINLGTREARFA